jgi:pimeloyl-ACP methyl ester carboxylesterase
VITLDLPGHGESPLIPEVEPTPIGYAGVVAASLDELGIDAIDMAGNSVGGWTALELAKLGRARSVVALGPAGLWLRNPLSARLNLWVMHHAPPPPVILLRSKLMRKLLLGRIFGRPERLPLSDIQESARVMRTTRGFDEHLRQTSRTRFTGGRDIEVPVTIAFGERERLIPPRARRGEELPSTTRWVSLPGCGHVPTWDAPELVAATILEGTAAPS